MWHLRKSKKEKLKEKVHDIAMMRNEFDGVWNMINYSYGYATSPLKYHPEQERLAFLNYMLDVFKFEMIVDPRSHCFFADGNPVLNAPLFPTCRASSLSDKTATVFVDPTTTAAVKKRETDMSIFSVFENG